ncbi:hypothetical protein [Cohnella lupini]|uniref:hypothetical protein n=1 Tax=Cohnella lupini TaxID=1294267 RepID=UPI000E2545FE|nr:hypothetical protein [Cohnella lupini]
MPRGNVCGKRTMTVDAANGVLAYDLDCDFEGSLGGELCGFIGGIRTAPIAPTTFVFGRGTAIRTRNL